jgi:hypothetical protein
MNDVFASVLVIVVGAILTAALSRRFEAFEKRIIGLAFVAHVVGAIAQIAITRGVYESGDMLMYMSEGSLVARAIELDPLRFGKYWLALLLQNELPEDLPLVGAGSSTGSMVALTTVLALVFRYSLYAVGFTYSTAACLGKIVLYIVFREQLPRSQHFRALAAIMLIPSSIFWAAGIIKEAVVIATLGFVWLGLHRLMSGRRLRGLLLFLSGASLIALIKPYTLFAVLVAAAAWFSVRRLSHRAGATGVVVVRPLYLVLAAVVVYAGVLAIGRVAPIYSVENLGEDLARQQGIGAEIRGGSTYAMGNAEAASIQQQITFAPIALATVFFRPFFFEVPNALAFLSSIEVSVLTFLLVQGLFRTGLRTWVRKVLTTPVFIGSAAFCLTFAVTVGLGSTNFGTLARYRTPLIPFYGLLVFVLAAPRKSSETVSPVRPLRARPSPRAFLQRERSVRRT